MKVKARELLVDVDGKVSVTRDRSAQIVGEKNEPSTTRYHS